MEKELATRFVQRSLPFLQRTLTNDWDKLFLMQHYGVPTRLLDWSENLFVAIYFALNGSAGSKNPLMLRFGCVTPSGGNQGTMAHFSFKGGVLDETSQAVRLYAPGTPYKEIPMPPVMIYGTYNSPRIVAQRGGFALFGQGTDPMEEVYITTKFSSKALVKIEIGKDYVEDIRASLFRKGFTESVVFPDLDGLAKEIRREFGFSDMLPRIMRITLHPSKPLIWWHTHRASIDMNPPYQRRGRLWSQSDKAYPD